MDGDGYIDKQEATDGIYHYSYSNPRNPDTDYDGIMDGMDSAPRYYLDKNIKQRGWETITLDGNISEWDKSSLISKGIINKQGHN